MSDPEELVPELPSSIVTYSDLARHKAAKKREWPSLAILWRRHSDAEDDLTFSVRRWRAALDEAKHSLSLPALMDRMHDANKGPLDQWSSIFSRELQRLGGLIDRESEGDIPSTLNVPEFERLTRAVLRRISEVKSLQSVPTLVVPEACGSPTTSGSVGGDMVTDAVVLHSGASIQSSAWQLFLALNGLHTVCSQSRMFGDLAKQRAEQRADDLKRANRGRQVAAFMPQEASEECLKPLPSRIFGETIKVCRRQLTTGRELCGSAREALRDGGAKGLDAVSGPNAAGQRRSIELHTMVQDADSLLVRLSIGLSDLDMLNAEDSEKMQALGARFGRMRDELHAVFDTRGLDAPAATPLVSVSPDLVAGLKAVPTNRSKKVGRRRRERSKADLVRELLSGEAPYEMNKTQLAGEVGYTHSSSLSRIKNFDSLWSQNELKLAAKRRESQKRMVPSRG